MLEVILECWVTAEIRVAEGAILVGEDELHELPDGELPCLVVVPPTRVLQVLLVQPLDSLTPSGECYRIGVRLGRIWRLVGLRASFIVGQRLIHNTTAVSVGIAAGLMARRINVYERVIQHIPVSVQSLGIRLHRNDGICLNETSDYRIVPPGAIVIQPAQALLPLPGVAVIRRRRAPGEAGLAKGSMSQLAHPAAGGIRHDARRAQVVAEEIEHAVVPRHRIALHPHGDTLSTKVIVEPPYMPGREAGRRAEGGRRGPRRCLSRSRGCGRCSRRSCRKEELALGDDLLVLRWTGPI